MAWSPPLIAMSSSTLMIKKSDALLMSKSPNWTLMVVAWRRFFPSLVGGFRDEDRDHAVGFVLVLLIRGVRCDRDIPESLSLD